MVKCRHNLGMHVANLQKCRCKVFPAPLPGFHNVSFATGGSQYLDRVIGKRNIGTMEDLVKDQKRAASMDSKTT